MRSPEWQGNPALVGRAQARTWEGLRAVRARAQTGGNECQGER